MADDMKMTRAELMHKIQKGWDDFNAYLKTLTLKQLTVPTDAAGWTAKDHVIHLAAWEDSISALLDGKSRPEAMGVDQATWDTRDFDKINAVIEKHHKNKSWDEVLRAFHASHARLMEKIEPLSDEDINRPFHHYQPGSTNETPVFKYLASDTYEHYEQHRPWIETIVAG
jgi:hypothetical protein